MEVKRKDMLICTEDHGGYLVGFCAVCRASGWLDKLKHKKECPVNLEVKYLKVEEFKGEN